MIKDEKMELGVMISYNEETEDLKASIGSDIEMKEIPKEIFQAVIASATVGLIDQYFDQSASEEDSRIDFFQETLEYIADFLEERCNKRTTLETLRYLVDKLIQEDKVKEIEEIQKYIDDLERGGEKIDK